MAVVTACVAPKRFWKILLEMIRTLFNFRASILLELFTAGGAAMRFTLHWTHTHKHTCTQTQTRLRKKYHNFPAVLLLLL